MDFKDITLVVGKNNAGKSTLIEALRLITIVFNRFKNVSYKNPPIWTKLYLADVGISPSLKGIEYSDDNILYDYEEPPAKIVVVFTNNVKAVIYLDEGKRIFAQIFNEHGKLVKNKSMARDIEVSDMKILPQIGPLLKEERLLNEEYVRINEFTSLSSIHFRNQIQYNFGLFNKFKSILEATWPDIYLSEFIKGSSIKDESPNLLIRDHSFVAEAGKMGHGLQMWLQIMWFLVRCNENDIVILDEPDVYLHADVQRKLIRILKKRYAQLIIATHSIEIISEVEPEKILIVNKKEQKSRYATNGPVVQEIINQLGSIHNLELIRLWASKKFIILEGQSDDIKLLKIFQDVIYPLSEIPFDNIPKVHIEGWGGWQRVIGSHQVISKNTEVLTYCILDSDYHSEEDIIKRYKEAESHGINLHIWKRKEIENYLIVDTAIVRFIKSSKDINLSREEVNEVLNQMCEDFKDTVFDSVATELHNRDRSKSLTSYNSETRKIMENNWKDLDDKLSMIPGKQFISALSKWSQEKFNISISKFALARALNLEEIDREIKYIVETIEQTKKINYAGLRSSN